MKSRQSLFPAALFAVALCVVASCATPSKTSTSTEPKPFTDSASGVVLPKKVGELSQTSLDDGEANNSPVTANYSSPGSIIGSVQIVKALDVSPQHLLAQTVRPDEARPGFSEEDYHGATDFGSAGIQAMQCGFDDAGTGTRVFDKIVIIPRGNFLLRFSFTVPAAQEREAQPQVDSFIHTILDKTNAKPVMMTPSTPPPPDFAD